MVCGLGNSLSNLVNLIVTPSYSIFLLFKFKNTGVVYSHRHHFLRPDNKVGGWGPGVLI